MIDIEDNGYIYIVGWSEYQNAEELSKLKERERCKEAMRAKRQREKQSKTCNNDVTNTDVTDKNKSKNKKENKSKSNNNNFSSGCYDKNAAVTCNSYENVTSDNNPVSFWNQDVTPITPYIAERLQAIAKEHGELIAMQAVTITAQQGKKSIAYCEGVARNLASGDNQKPKKPPDDQTDLDKYF